MPAMAKKKGIYADVPRELKERLRRVANANGRKLNAELGRALEKHLSAEEKRLGLPPMPPAQDEK